MYSNALWSTYPILESWLRPPGSSTRKPSSRELSAIAYTGRRPGRVYISLGSKISCAVSDQSHRDCWPLLRLRLYSRRSRCRYSSPLRFADHRQTFSERMLRTLSCRQIADNRCSVCVFTVLQMPSSIVRPWNRPQSIAANKALTSSNSGHLGGAPSPLSVKPESMSNI